LTSLILGFGRHERVKIGPAGGAPRERVWGVSPPPPPEILKALQNRVKLNPFVKTVKNC